MAKADIKWEKVTFGEKREARIDVTFRPSGQIVFGVAALRTLGYPKYVDFYISPSTSQLAMKASDGAEGAALQLTATVLPEDQPRTISGKRAYRWLCGLLGQEEGEVLIRLMGEEAEKGMLVFDLKKTAFVPKRVRRDYQDAGE